MRRRLLARGAHRCEIGRPILGRGHRGGGFLLPAQAGKGNGSGGLLSRILAAVGLEFDVLLADGGLKFEDRPFKLGDARMRAISERILVLGGGAFAFREGESGGRFAPGSCRCRRILLRGLADAEIRGQDEFSGRFVRRRGVVICRPAFSSALGDEPADRGEDILHVIL